MPILTPQTASLIPYTTLFRSSNMPKATRAAEALNATPTDEDRKYDLSLRPTHLTEYIGQTKAKENLRVYIKAATMRREALDRSEEHTSELQSHHDLVCRLLIE